jgi:hypothetical protein
MRSRLEAVGEAKGSEVGLLDEVVRVGGALGQPERKAVEGVEMGEGLRAEVRGRIGQDQSR